ncbi:uncharacterized protein C16orf46 homolog isoform X2 [Hoplias malabaricus]
MNNLKSCDSGHIDDEKTETMEDLEWGTHQCLDREHVNALLDISEEHTFKEQDPYEVQHQGGWDEAIQGWRRSAPLACLFQTQKKGKKVKPDIIDFHCILCADLKDPKLSELCVSDGVATSSESSCETAEEPMNNSIPSTPEVVQRIRNNSSPSSSEEETSDCSIQEKNTTADLLGNKLMFRSEQCTQITSLPSQYNAKIPFLKGAGRAALIGNILILPPVKPSTPTNSKMPFFLKGREACDQCPAEREANSVVVCGATRAVIVGEKGSVKGDRENTVVIPYCSSTVDTCQGSLTCKHGPSQHQYELLSIPVPKKALLPFSTLEDTLPRNTCLLGRTLRQEERTRSPLRQNSGHRPHLGFKVRNTRRAEPVLPVLLGTRVALPVSAQR